MTADDQQLGILRLLGQIPGRLVAHHHAMHHDVGVVLRGTGQPLRQEFLFTGDVAWHMRNIALVRERARMVTAFMLGEDRDAVLSQLAALNALQKAEPNLHMVVGHDPGPVDTLERAGLLIKGF